MTGTIKRKFIDLDGALPYGCLTGEPSTKHEVVEGDNLDECHSLVRQRPTVRVELPPTHSNEDGTPSKGWEVIDTRDLPAEYFHEGGEPPYRFTRVDRAKQLTRLIKRDRQWFKVGYDADGKLGEIASGPTLDEVLTGAWAKKQKSAKASKSAK